jgi:hypothetical protein
MSYGMNTTKRFKMSDNWPKVWVLFATYKRTAAALATIESLERYLKYPNCHFHICDDGSGETDDGTGRDHVEVLKARFAEFYPEATAHVMNTPPGQFDTGGNVNTGIKLAREAGCDIHVLIFDDWCLLRELDIRPHVDLLDTNDQVGFIRLSYMVPGNNGCIVGYWCPRVGGEHIWYRLIRQWSLANPYGPSDSYIISTQPYVAHTRFFDTYGWHPEHVNPGIAETCLGNQYNYHRVGENGPQVLFYIGPGVVHAPWSHLVGRANDYAKV